MQAYEFYASIEDGIIKIPNEHVGKLPSYVKIIILANEKTSGGKRCAFPDFAIDTSSFVFNREEANERYSFFDTNLFVYMQSATDKGLFP